MKLEPGERSILGNFASGPQAEQALAELKQAGYAEAQMDRVGEYGFRPDVFEQRPAIAGKETSLARTVLGPASVDDDTAVLLAATPEASGMSGGVDEDVKPFLITVVTQEERVQDAVKIMQKHGGRV